VPSVGFKPFQPFNRFAQFKSFESKLGISSFGNAGNSRPPLSASAGCYGGPVNVCGERDVFRARNADVKIVCGRAELTESKLLTLDAAGVDAILGNMDEMVSDAKSDDRYC
jgi:hypothetical protein